MLLLPEGLRRATESETADWLAGYLDAEEIGGYETDEGLLVRDLTCHCGEAVHYDGTWDRDKHRRCHLIP